MKDIVIKGKEILREIYILIACFVVAELVNVYAILQFDRPWTELYSMIGMVLALAIILYILLAILRALLGLIIKIIKRK